MDLFNFLIETDHMSFKTLFDNYWFDLCSKKFSYSSATQLRIGNRLRPKLLCWGYAVATGKSIDEFDFKTILQLSASVEMIHKASIILDDLIDDDHARHGLSAFHCEFSNEEAILFSNVLVVSSFINLNNLNSYFLQKSQDIVSSMVNGCLKEVVAITPSKQATAEIIKGETIALIEGALTMGAKIEESNEKITSLLGLIGSKCGMLFQILNDLEPFADRNKNAIHKGTANFDLNKNRKNYVVSTIREMTDIELRKDTIFQYYINNNIYQLIKDEIEKMKKDIFSLADSLRNFNNHSNTLQFIRYIDFLIKACLERL